MWIIRFSLRLHRLLFFLQRLSVMHLSLSLSLWSRCWPSLRHGRALHQSQHASLHPSILSIIHLLFLRQHYSDVTDWGAPSSPFLMFASLLVSVSSPPLAHYTQWESSSGPYACIFTSVFFWSFVLGIKWSLSSFKSPWVWVEVMFPGQL